MVQVFAVGRIRHRREVVGYKLLNLVDLSVTDYSLDRLSELLKSGNIVGNLYYDKSSNSVKEYYCSRTLTEFNQNNKRIGKGKDTFLTVITESCSAGLSHYHSSEVFYSREGLYEVKDIFDLNYFQHYDVDSLKECMPFLNDDPVDMYVKNFRRYYEKCNVDDSSLHYELDNMGMMTINVLEDIEKLEIGFCRALKSLESEPDEINNINELLISEDCESVLPESISNFNIDKVVIEQSSVCSNAFCKCNLGYVNIELIERNSKDDIFKDCDVKYLVLPKWYDSWNILNCFKHIDTLELTNTSCTNSIWEISAKDKLLFKKVKNLILPSNFDYEQESSLREAFVDVNIKRKL